MALSDNPFALLNPGPLPARIPNSFGPPPGTIMPNNYDRIKAMLDAQQAGAALHGQTLNQPFTAEQIMQLFPGPTPEQKAQTQESRIGTILADQQAGAALHGQTLNQPLTASQIMAQFPATVNPYPQDLQRASSPMSLASAVRPTSPVPGAVQAPAQTGTPWWQGRTRSSGSTWGRPGGMGGK